MYKIITFYETKDYILSESFSKCVSFELPTRPHRHIHLQEKRTVGFIGSQLQTCARSGLTPGLKTHFFAVKTQVGEQEKQRLGFTESKNATPTKSLVPHRRGVVGPIARTASTARAKKQQVRIIPKQGAYEIMAR